VQQVKTREQSSNKLMVMSVHDVARINTLHNIWKITIFSKCLVAEVPDITNIITIIIIIIIIVVVITTTTILIITISSMQGIYTYIPETNHVPREYSVAAILSLLFMVPIIFSSCIGFVVLLR
jgi:hypothetical protein